MTHTHPIRIVKYSLKTEADFGTVLCWGDNHVGRGRPCRFNIWKVDFPEPPARCQVADVAQQSFKVKYKSYSSSHPI